MKRRIANQEKSAAILFTIHNLALM